MDHREPAARPLLPADTPLGASTEALAGRLHSAAIQLLRLLRREDVHMGLTGPRASALSVLVFGGPRTLGELAATEQVRPPTMTHLVRALERAGLVRRTRDKADGRVFRLHATKKGRAVLLEGRDRRVQRLTDRLAPLDDAERATIARAVEVLERVLRDLA